jgi:formylmethanofuran dehydrogenase subunit E
VFVDVQTGHAVRVAPALDIRQRACRFVPDEPRHYFAQMRAYRTMSDEEMFIITKIQLAESIETILSHPGLSVNCDVCGEDHD